MKIRYKFTIALIFASIFIAGASAQSNETNLTLIGTSAQSVVAGTNATYVLNLTNAGTLTDNYTLTIANLDLATTADLNITSPVMLVSGASRIFALNVTNASAGIFNVNVTATSENDPTRTASVNTTTVVSVLQTEVNATVDIKPETLNLKSKGEFTAFISLPGGFNVTDIIPGTVMCDGAPAVSSTVSQENGGTLIVKFITQYLVNVPTGNAVTLTVTGKISSNGALLDFQGSDTIRVIDNGKGGKLGGAGNAGNTNVGSKVSNNNKQNTNTNVDSKESKNKGKNKVNNNLD